MKILNKQETDQLRISFKHGFFHGNQIVVEALDNLEVGGSLFIERTEWGGKNDPASHVVNRFFQGKLKVDKDFTVKRLNDGKSFAILRNK